MKKLYTAIYAVIIAALLFFFFTNDFGIVDIRKSSIVVALGIDGEEEELKVTAQIAVPQPSESGSATQCAQIDGSGATIGEALNEINVKAGFYPKLTFCNLILLGDSLQNNKIFEVMDYFYRGDYIPRTARIAMCDGAAGELLAKQAASGEIPAEAVGRAISDELKSTANVASASLKDIAVDNKTASAGCYMPYVEFSSVEGGASLGAEAAQSQGEKYEFYCNRTAIFSGGEFCTLLSKEQTFAFNLLNNPVRLAILAVQCDGNNYVLGLKNIKGGIAVKLNGGKARVAANFKCKAELRSSDGQTTDKFAVPKSVLSAAEEKIEDIILDLFAACREAQCDVLQLKTNLYAYHPKQYSTISDDVYSLPLDIKVNIKSKI